MITLIKNRPLLSSVLLATLLVAVGAGIYMAQWRTSKRPVTFYAWHLPSGPIFLAEDFQHPRLQEYRRHEHLDEVIRPHQTDFAKILALSQWASRQFPATSPLPNYPPWDGQIILDRIRHGKTGGFCAQYAFIFGQACQSVGFQPRYLDVASPEDVGGHFTAEVYVPSLKKWVVFEAEFGMYYVDKRGRPLSALELHQWAVGTRNDPVLELPLKKLATQSWLRLFYHFRYYLRNNFLTVPVFARPTDNGLGFEPYRLYWSDAYTSDAPHLADAISSSEPGDFDYALQTEPFPELDVRTRVEFYQALVTHPVYQICKIRMPLDAFTRLIKKDFIHNPLYHSLKS